MSRDWPTSYLASSVPNWADVPQKRIDPAANYGARFWYRWHFRRADVMAKANKIYDRTAAYQARTDGAKT